MDKIWDRKSFEVGGHWRSCNQWFALYWNIPGTVLSVIV